MRECIDDYSAYFMNNKWLDRLGATPKESFEAKIEDAIAIDELSLSMYLGGELKLRKVLNKGLSLNGTLFIIQNYTPMKKCLCVKILITKTKSFALINKKNLFV